MLVNRTYKTYVRDYSSLYITRSIGSGVSNFMGVEKSTSSSSSIDSSSSSSLDSSSSDGVSSSSSEV